MNRMYEQDWDGALAVASKDDLSAVARAAIEFDWDSGDMRVLGRLMSKVGLDLATAVQVFLNGRPQDFNHMAKEDVPLRDSARFSMLECLYRKICCGFYLPNPEIGLAPFGPRHRAGLTHSAGIARVGRRDAGCSMSASSRPFRTMVCAPL